METENLKCESIYSLVTSNNYSKLISSGCKQIDEFFGVIFQI